MTSSTEQRQRTVLGSHLQRTGISILIALGIVALSGCDAELSAWTQAEQDGSVAAYEYYLSRFPDSDRAEEATARIVSLQWEAAVGEALEASAAEQSETLSVGQLLALHYDGSAGAPLPDLQRAQALSVLADALIATNSGALSIESYRAESGPPQVLAPTSLSIQGTLRTREGECTATLETVYAGFADANLIGISGCIFLRGRPEPDAEVRVNVRGAYGVSQEEDFLRIWMNREGQEFLLLQDLNNFGNMEAAWPSGEGTLIEFSGSVQDFVPGWRIEGDPENPLVFVLLSDRGLTYVTGAGTVYNEDDSVALFP